MTQITIPLVQGDNFISFPASSANTFGDIFTSSTVRDEISNFYKYHPILGPIPVMDTDHIEECIGYHLYITIPGNIIYDSTGDFYTTLGRFESRILKGWNLLATGSNTIILPSWCNVIDAKTGIPATQLEPTKAYWINSEDCSQPRFNAGSALYFIGAIGTVLFTVYLLREFKIIRR